MKTTHRVAYLPEQRPDVVSPQWLDWLKDVGYTSLLIEFDPFSPPRSGNMSQFPTLYRLISLYDLAWGENRVRLREWADGVCRDAHARGLKVYLKLWEPRIPAEAWGLFPVEWHGRGGWDRVPWNHISWCLSEPAAAGAFARMAKEGLAAVPRIDGVCIGTHDNDACHCNDDCPRCRGVDAGEKFSRLFRTLLRATADAGLDRAGFEYFLYTWWWTPQQLDAVANLFGDRAVRLLGRSTQGLTQSHRGRELGKVFDLCLGIPGVGEGFVAEAKVAKERGWPLLDMAAFGHTIEYFWQPYTPVPRRVAERIVEPRKLGCAGWFDYDCGGLYPGINAEVVRTDAAEPRDDAAALASATLKRLYPPDELSAADRAYALAEEALALRPIGIDVPDVRLLSGRNTWEVAIALPFDPGDVSGLDQGHRIAFFAPSNFITRSVIDGVGEMLADCERRWLEGWEIFRTLRGTDAWRSILDWEKQVYRAHALCAGSVRRYVQMGANRLLRGRGEIGAREERLRLNTIFTEELTAAEEFAGMWRGDRRLLMNPNIRLVSYLQQCAPWIPINRDDPFVTKIEHTKRMLVKLQDPQMLDAVPAWE